MLFHKPRCVAIGALKHLWTEGVGCTDGWTDRPSCRDALLHLKWKPHNLIRLLIVSRTTSIKQADFKKISGKTWDRKFNEDKSTLAFNIFFSLKVLFRKECFCAVLFQICGSLLRGTLVARGAILVARSAMLVARGMMLVARGMMLVTLSSVLIAAGSQLIAAGSPLIVLFWW